MNSLVPAKPSDVWEIWHRLTWQFADHIVDLSHQESFVFLWQPSALFACNSIDEVVPIIFRLYSVDSSLYRLVSHFLLGFPMPLLGKFLKELRGLLSYVYIIQSAIQWVSDLHPIVSECVVYRGLSFEGESLMPLYESLIGAAIVWPGFSSTSRDREMVIKVFIDNDSGILFEIKLNAGAVACSIDAYSEYPGESEILIAAASTFVVTSVELIDVEFTRHEPSRSAQIPLVKLEYCCSWYDWDVQPRQRGFYCDWSAFSGPTAAHGNFPG
jgi:hypothetical protein